MSSDSFEGSDNENRELLILGAPKKQTLKFMSAKFKNKFAQNVPNESQLLQI